jgi:regulator of protease activity HflC (stomatin/prohibitin superfamily)
MEQNTNAGQKRERDRVVHIGEPSSRPSSLSDPEYPPGLERRVSEVLASVQRVVVDGWAQVQAEAEDLMRSARRARDDIHAEAEREAARTLATARERAAEILTKARAEAAAIAQRSEELSREFLARLSSLVKEGADSTIHPVDGERPPTNGVA